MLSQLFKILILLLILIYTIFRLFLCWNLDDMDDNYTFKDALLLLALFAGIALVSYETLNAMAETQRLSELTHHDESLQTHDSQD